MAAIDLRLAHAQKVVSLFPTEQPGFRRRQAVHVELFTVSNRQLIYCCCHFVYRSKRAKAEIETNKVKCHEVTTIVVVNLLDQGATTHAAHKCPGVLGQAAEFDLHGSARATFA